MKRGTDGGSERRRGREEGELICREFAAAADNEREMWAKSERASGGGNGTLRISETQSKGERKEGGREGRKEGRKEAAMISSS